MKRILSILLAALGTVSSAQAQNDPAADRIEEFFTAEEIQSDWFTQSFLNAVSASQLQPIREQVTGGIGSFRYVRNAGDRYHAVFESAYIPVLISLASDGRISGLRLLNPVPLSESLDDVLSDIEELPGTVSVYISRNGQELRSLAGGEPLAVGSTFKLAVLAALDREISNGNRSWSDVVELTEDAKSLPSGILQDWPAGSRLTLSTLATLMISRSDNTATDLLIRTLERERIEELAPENVPFLTTRELFVLKDDRHQALRTRYLAAETAEKRRILAEIAGEPLPNQDIFDDGPVAQEIEWFFSAERLCELIEQVSHLELFSVNPGVADPTTWRRVQFKGGSEPGVLNMTTRVEQADGTSYCISVTQNRPDSTIDEGSMTGLYSALLDRLNENGGESE